MQEALVKMKGIDKSFPGVKALDNVELEILPGEVHALVGENGAGKSTLMKILTGSYTKDAGTIWVKGKEVEVKNPRAATELGISIIHQELSTVPHLTLAQNIFLGREAKDRLGFVVDEKRINAETKKIFESMHLDLDPRAKAGSISVAKQQMTEIAKAVSYNSEIIIMDEPTAALTDSEIEELFAVIRRFKAGGAGIVYISHRMEELKQICDRVTVMRDGCYVTTQSMKDVSRDDIINYMVGRTIYESVDDTVVAGEKAETVLEVEHVSRGKELKDCSFTLRRGEILGFSGLMGSGRTELARAIIGADRKDAGTIKVKGSAVRIKTPKDAVQCGIGYLSEDRKKDGLALGLTVENNISLPSLVGLSTARFVVNKKKAGATAKEYVEKLNIKTPSIRQRAVNLSGGNQQKIVIAKWLLRNCDILIFDEPTRGIDVGAKSEIYKLLNDLAATGKSIIMISSELPEIIRMSHRVVVMCEGRITGELPRSELSQETIMHLATKMD